jgi:hypothetical protein
MVRRKDKSIEMYNIDPLAGPAWSSHIPVATRLLTWMAIARSSLVADLDVSRPMCAKAVAFSADRCPAFQGCDFALPDFNLLSSSHTFP